MLEYVGCSTLLMLLHLLMLLVLLLQLLLLLLLVLFLKLQILLVLLSCRLRWRWVGLDPGGQSFPAVVLVAVGLLHGVHHLPQPGLWRMVAGPCKVLCLLLEGEPLCGGGGMVGGMMCC